MMVIADLLGVPRADVGQFKIWSDAIVEPFSKMATRERRIECARLVVEMQTYFADMVAERAQNPRDDLISEAIAYRDQGGEAFTMQELMTVITIDLLASGNETTTAAIGSGLYGDTVTEPNPDIGRGDSAAGVAGAGMFAVATSRGTPELMPSEAQLDNRERLAIELGDICFACQEIITLSIDAMIAFAIPSLQASLFGRGSTGGRPADSIVTWNKWHRRRSPLECQFKYAHDIRRGTHESNQLCTDLRVE